MKIIYYQIVVTLLLASQSLRVTSWMPSFSYPRLRRLTKSLPIPRTFSKFNGGDTANPIASNSLLPKPNRGDADELDFENGSAVTWKAAVSSSTRVKELKRTVEQYMALPASQYSVLTAEQVIRESDKDFKIVLGTLNFFGTKITPILYVTVNVHPDQAKSEIIVVRAETTGSPTAVKINGTFSISAVNTVSAGKDQQDRKTLTSDTKLRIDAIVPKGKIPSKVIKSGGNFVLQSSLNIIVPTFIRILAADFRRWSAGDDRRDALEGAKLDLQ